MTTTTLPRLRSVESRQSAESAAVELIVRLTAVLQDRMTTAGHPYALVMSEHRGTCPAQYCSDRCVEYTALYREAVAFLRAHEDAAPVTVESPRQMRMEEAG